MTCQEIYTVLMSAGVVKVPGRRCVVQDSLPEVTCEMVWQSALSAVMVTLDWIVLDFVYCS